MMQYVTGRDQQALVTLTNPQAILALLGTLHAAALRRSDQKRYDFAALFRYRCLELMSQHRLATAGILSNKPIYNQINIPPEPGKTSKAILNNRFQKKQGIIGRKQPTGLPKYSISLFDGYLILAALDDPLVHGIDLLQIERRTKARNLSVLAHGYQLIGESEYDTFAEIVDVIIDRLFDTLKEPRQTWEAIIQYIQPW
jgi:CRISPR-associated protein (TIGR02710 family)